MKIYLDVCCLNRPFDDQSQDRIRFESEAILTILGYHGNKNWILIGSEVIDIEISKIPDPDRQQKVQFLSSMRLSQIIVDEKVEERAVQLEQLGFQSFDALHIACAEKGKADVLLTTDSRLIAKAIQNREILKVRLENPTRWLTEVIEK